MILNIAIVCEDFKTPYGKSAPLDNILIDDDFRNFLKVADTMDLSYLKTIDINGYTIFNSLQLKRLEQEVQQLRNRSDVNQKIVEALQKPLDVLKKDSIHLYLKLEAE